MSIRVAISRNEIMLKENLMKEKTIAEHQRKDASVLLYPFTDAEQQEEQKNPREVVA